MVTSSYDSDDRAASGPLARVPWLRRCLDSVSSWNGGEMGGKSLNVWDCASGLRTDDRGLRTAVWPVREMHLTAADDLRSLR
jgi:hypothetical protein